MCGSTRRFNRSLSVHSGSAEAKGERLRTLDSFQRLLWHLAGKVELVVLKPSWMAPWYWTASVRWTSGLTLRGRDWTEAGSEKAAAPQLFPAVTEPLDASYILNYIRRNAITRLSGTLAFGYLSDSKCGANKNAATLEAQTEKENVTLNVLIFR